MTPLVRSTSARLAVSVALAFLVGFALLGGGVYLAVSALIAGDARQVVSADGAGLAELYRDGGAGALADELRARLAHPNDADAVYALFDPRGAAIVGAPARLPPRRDKPRDDAVRGGKAAREVGGGRWLEFRMPPADGGGRVVAWMQQLPDGSVLMAGLKMRSTDRFLAVMFRTALAALLVAALLGALVGLSAARWVSRRLRGLDHAAGRVAAGELGLRASTDGSDDAFDRVSLRFNTMLDRIEELLDGVRHATDHIAHDLRTPLTRLRNRLELLRDRGRGRDGGDDVPAPELDAAIAETDQLLQSFSALLRLARIEAQAPADDQPVVDLGAVARDALELYVPIAAERGIALRDTVATAAALPSRSTPMQVRGDADQLFQLVINLLDNAVKFSDAGGEVVLGLSADGGDIRLEVSDRGPGIAPADRMRVQDRFVRLEAHRGTPGTGLGLSLVRAIVLHHRGGIELADNAPGLRVGVRLPRA
ncbi:MAG TPA: HAMP domain-containing sensor histidine kinase [Luteimonas sp.]|nr:HAMP domain-containing sensor histidine kinase [Luteimonas sp.]